MDQSSLPTLSLDETNFERAIHFFDIYDLEAEVGFEKKKTFLGTKTPRVCRFCHKTDKEVKFSNDAHVLPQFTGNRNLMSYFECDVCNARFSDYEDSLSKYIGITRTIHQVKGKSATKVPKFKDPKTGLELSLEEKGLRLAIQDGSEEIEMDEKNKKLIIRTVRHSYIPIHIPKSLLKIAFCLLGENELENYDQLRQFLIQSKEDESRQCSSIENHPMFQVYGYFMPGPTYFRTPSALLYTKKKGQQTFRAPQKQIVFQYASYLFQMPLPLGKGDSWLYGEEMHVPLHPLMVDTTHFEKYGNYQSFNLNLTSTEKKKDEPHVITFNIDTVIKPDQGER